MTDDKAQMAGDEGKRRPNWFAGVSAALPTSVLFGIMWDDWVFGVAIGAMIGIAVAFIFETHSRK